MAFFCKINDGASPKLLSFVYVHKIGVKVDSSGGGPAHWNGTGILYLPIGHYLTGQVTLEGSAYQQLLLLSCPPSFFLIVVLLELIFNYQTITTRL